MKRLAFILMALCALSSISNRAEAQTSDYLCKQINDDWSWYSDHVMGWIKYVVAAAPGREYQIGTGISVGGKPRGSIRKAAGKTEVTAFGIGAIHVRLSDGKGPGTVCVAQGDFKTVTFPEITF